MSEGVGPGSGGNVLAAVCSFFIPGLGQLCQGRLIMAAIHFILTGALWVITAGMLGWIMHLWSTYSAATYKP